MPELENATLRVRSGLLSDAVVHGQVLCALSFSWRRIIMLLGKSDRADT